MRLLLPLMALCLSLSLAAQKVILTGIIDGDLSANGQGGNPKVIELYVNGNLDLTGYQLSRTNSSNVFTFPSGSTYTDEFVYVVNSNGEALFQRAFSTAGDFTNYLISDQLTGNGNDPYQLLNASGTILDQTGGPIGADNNYRDGHRYRVSNTGPDGGWEEANWGGGNTTLDGQPITAYASITGFGSYTVNPSGPSVSVIANGNLTEPATGGGFMITLSQAAASPVIVTYTLSGTTTITDDYRDLSGGQVTIAAGMLTTAVDLAVVDDLNAEPVETIILTLAGVSGNTFSVNGEATISLLDNESVTTQLISAVQGSGSTSPLVGQDVTIEGIVVGDFQGSTGEGLGGFFVMEEDTDQDGSAATSEGIWVSEATSGTAAVSVGDLVIVTGKVVENSDLTTLDISGSDGAVTIVSSDNTLPSAAMLDLPITNDDTYEAVEGMLTTVVDAVTITETFSVGRYGEFTVTEGERLIQFTECNEPNAAELATYNAAQAARSLIVDDGRLGDNAYPIVLGNGQLVDANNSLRSGSVITNLTGVVDQRFGDYRLQGTAFTVESNNARPTTAPAVGGNITVVGMNVLNYFTTLNSRGADNQAEFDRQEAKIVAAICELDADIIGLVEIENNGVGATSALQTLVNAIAADCGKTYAFVVNPDSGTDQIQVALIYKSDVVVESGVASSLNTPASVFSRNRNPLAQTFRVVEAGNPDLGEELTVCVNHWKSKGSSCGTGDDDNGGAGNCNGSRTEAAEVIRDWLSTSPTGTADSDYLIVGDLNAYSQEAPIKTLLDAGYVNTVRASAGTESFPCGSIPSYVFRGEWGSLDHALASAMLAPQVTGATPWTVNAPEPTALDYDTDFNNAALYADDFYRFSDHDPVVVGLDLNNIASAVLAIFTGRPVENTVQLNWSTEREEATNQFEVERRTPTADFTVIGTVMATGNSTTVQEYTFTDTTPAAGDNDYRLRIIDADGNVTRSEIVTVAFTTSVVEITALGDGRFRFSGADAGAKYAVTDASGRTLRTGEVAESFTMIDGRGLPTGVYFLLLHNRQGQGRSFKLVIR